MKKDINDSYSLFNRMKNVLICIDYFEKEFNQKKSNNNNDIEVNICPNKQAKN